MGETTAYEIGLRLFPNLEGFGIMLGVSEAVGHLDLLVERGLVDEVDTGPVRFAAR
jgi:hypothetical protein